MVAANIVVALIILTILIAVVPDLQKESGSSAYLYLMLLVTVMVMLVANALSLYTIADADRTRHNIATAIYYLSYYAVLSVFTWCLIFRNGELSDNPKIKKRKEIFSRDSQAETYWIGTVRRLRVSDLPQRTLGYISTAVCAFSAAVWIYAMQEELFVTIEDGAFQQGVLYGLGQVGGIVVTVINFFLIWNHRGILGREMTITHLTYVLVPVVSAAHRFFFYEDSILCIAIGVTTVLIFVTTQINYSRRLREQELELAHARASIIMTQIQPHFIYNTLNTIYHLCGSAPKKAQTATGLFSDYLRENLESINRRTPVPFSVELNHIKTYLTLEQMRFEERLQVVYDIRADRFLLPPLTVQPIVENAVRHGVGKRVKGGTVTIAAYETEDAFEVTVTDDGVGLNVLQNRSSDGGAHEASAKNSADRQEKHTGIGIENVRTRLREISGGTLTVESVPGGNGVVARVSVPKEGNIV